MHSRSVEVLQTHWSCEVLKWMWIDWLDLPKLTTLTTSGHDSNTFQNPRHIILESDSHPLWMMFRHAQSHRCVSSTCIQLQERRHNPRKYSLHPSLTNRHRSSSTILQLITETCMISSSFCSIHNTLVHQKITETHEIVSVRYYLTPTNRGHSMFFHFTLSWLSD